MRTSFLFGVLAASVFASSMAYGDPATTTKSAAAHSTAIAIGNFTFAPNTITVAVGTTLVWTNEDDVPHIVIGTDANSPIKSPPLDTNDRYSLVVTKPGTYKYFCSIHPKMVGTIVVQ